MRRLEVKGSIALFSTTALPLISALKVDNFYGGTAYGKESLNNGKDLVTSANPGGGFATALPS